MKTGFYYNEKINSTAIVTINPHYLNICAGFIHEFRYRVVVGSYSDACFTHVKFLKEKLKGYEYIGKV